MFDIYRDTLQMLVETKIPVKRIADESGLNYRWIMRVKTKDIPTPGTQPMQRLYNTLLGHQLLGHHGSSFATGKSHCAQEDVTVNGQ